MIKSIKILKMRVSHGMMLKSKPQSMLWQILKNGTWMTYTINDITQKIMYIYKVRSFTWLMDSCDLFSISMPDMNKPDANCLHLIERTAAALTNNVLQALFVSTQQNSLKLCVQYGLKWWVMFPNDKWCWSQYSIYRVLKNIIKIGSATTTSRILHQPHSRAIPEKMLKRAVFYAGMFFPFSVVGWSCFCVRWY